MTKISLGKQTRGIIASNGLELFKKELLSNICRNSQLCKFLNSARTALFLPMILLFNFNLSYKIIYN